MNAHTLLARLSRALLAAAVVAGSIVWPVAATPSAHAASTPQTVPALREWRQGPTATTFGSASRILVDPAGGATALADAQTFAADLASIVGRTPQVVTAQRSQAAVGDVFLSVDASVASAVGNDEGYRLEVGGFFAVTGVTPTGVFHGTRTLLQLFRQSATVPGGEAYDWPTFPERGIRIDNVPRTYSSNWWRNLIRELSYLKLTMLQAPLIGGYGLTQAEVADITTFAAKYHIQFTGTVALTGHADPVLDDHPELELFDPAGAPPATGRSLDYTKLDFAAGANNVVQQYLDEYLPQSPSEYFHISGDEFLAYPGWTDAQWSKFPQLTTFAKSKLGSSATASDGYLWFLNWVNGQVKARGKTMRVWNDTLENSPRIALDADVVVEYWYTAVRPMSTTVTQIAARQPLLNVRSDYLYQDMDRGSENQLDPQEIYDHFTPVEFPGGITITGDARSNIRGGMIALWLGLPTNSSQALWTNEVVFSRLQRPLRALAQKTWASANPGAFSSFDAIAVGTAPGFATTRGTAEGKAAWFPDASSALSRTTDGRLLYITPAADSMWRTTQIAAGVAGDPVTAVVDGHRVFVARGSTGALLYGRQDGASWQVSTLITSAVGQPALAVDAEGRATYVVRRGDGKLWSGRPDSSGVAITSGIAGDPVLIAQASGRLAWFARTTGGELRFGSQDAAGAWVTPGTDLLGSVTGQPGVLLDVNGKLTVFARATNGDILHGWESSPGGFWDPVTATLVTGAAGDPVVARDVSGKLTLFVRTSNGDLVHRWQATPGGGWYAGEYVLIEGTTADPVVVSDGSHRLGFLIARSDGALWWRRQSTAGGGWAASVRVAEAQTTVPPAVAGSGSVGYLATTPDAYLVRGWITPQDTLGRWIVTAS